VTPEERGSLRGLADVLEIHGRLAGDDFTRSALLQVAKRLRSLAAPEARNRA